jgi:uncharacterized membrane protein YqaE (UPF0057 family)
MPIVSITEVIEVIGYQLWRGVLWPCCLGKQFWINILLTLLGYIPGIVHAVWVIAKY